MTLPTSPGRYRDNDGDLWSFNTDGTANLVGTSAIWYADEVSRLAAFGPFTPEADDTEERAKLQDRIEVLEKNLAYEVAQKIKLAEQLQAATTTSLTLEQARWKMHAGIDSRCSEEVAAKAKPVIDLVLSSLALEPEARELTDTNNQGE